MDRNLISFTGSSGGRMAACAATGLLEVRTDEGTASLHFCVFKKAGVEIVDAYMC